MKELSLNILDITKNSVTAGASLITVSIIEENGFLTVSIDDNGCGMSPEFLASVTDPFTTTRKTRKVGMGIPLFKLAAEQSGGQFSISSTLNVGTTITASFALNNIDTPPLGDIASTIVLLIQGSPDIDFIFKHHTPAFSYQLSTAELRDVLGGVPLNEPDVLNWINDYINENMSGNSPGKADSNL